MNDTDEIPWGAFGAEWWINEAKELGARDDRHAAFAACRYAGLNRTRSAVLAGYSPDRANKAGSEADRARSVKFLSMAAHAKAKADGLEEPGDKLVTREDIRKQLSDTIKRGSLTEKIKAIELHEKLFTDERKADDNDDGFNDFRLARMYLSAPNGAAAFVLLHSGSGMSISSLSLFHDVAAAVKREQPELWGCPGRC